MIKSIPKQKNQKKTFNEYLLIRRMLIKNNL